MLNWKNMIDADFNRVAEQLIRTSVMQDNPGVVVNAVDGRGGDGGIDLEARAKRTGQLVGIYQLKYFPEGFSGNWGKSRKNQITRSYAAAMQHVPPAWTLVVPGNLTPGERTFVHSLKSGKVKPIIRCMGAVELDELLIRFPSVASFAESTPLREALEITGRSSAALNRPGDISAEVSRIAERARARSDYWDVDFSRRGDTILESVVPRRDDAAEREPLSIAFITDFTQHEQLQRRFLSAIEFGNPQPLVLPPEVVREFRTEGPEWFARTFGAGTLELNSMPSALPGVGDVSLLGADGWVLAQRDAKSLHVVRGTLGGQLIVDIGDRLKLTFVMTFGDNPTGRVEVASNLTGLSASAAKRVLRFLVEFGDATHIRFGVDGNTTTAGLEPHDSRSEVILLELADDLAYIEDATNVSLPFPDEIKSDEDRIWIRVLRRLLEGKITLLPGIGGVEFVLERTPEEELLRHLIQGGPVVQSTPLFEYTLFGKSITIPRASVMMHDAKADNRESLIQAIETGRVVGRQIRMVPSDGVSGVLIARSDLDTDWRLDEVTPWALTGIDEHPQLG